MDAAGRTARSPWRMPLRAWREVAARSWKEASVDNVGLISAGVAFYGFLAVLPMLAATVLTYGIFVEPRTVIGHMQDLTRVLPEAAAIAVGEQLLQLAASPDERKGLGVLISLAIALFGARNAAGVIITALNIAYEEEEKRGFFRLTLTALALTASAVPAAIAAATSVTLLVALGGRTPAPSQAMLLLSNVVTYTLLTLAGAAAAAILYRFGPSRQAAKWIWLTPGSVFSALGWLALTFGFGAYAKYIGKFDATYGSLGAVVALLTWLYLASYVLLLGAELNSELEHQTAEDTTRGAPKPMGTRKAWVADHVAGDDAPARLPPADTKLALPAPHRPSARPPTVPERPARAAGWAATTILTMGLVLIAGSLVRSSAGRGSNHLS